MAASAGEEEKARDGAPPCLTVQRDGMRSSYYQVTIKLQVGNDDDCTSMISYDITDIILWLVCLCHPGNLYQALSVSGSAHGA